MKYKTVGEWAKCIYKAIAMYIHPEPDGGISDWLLRTKKKDSQLAIRISGSQRVEFIELCEELDTSTAREIRRFIKQFIAENSS